MEKRQLLTLNRQREERQRARAREREREREREKEEEEEEEVSSLWRRRTQLSTDFLLFFLFVCFLVRNSIKYEYDERFNEWGSEGREVGEGVWRANEDDKSRQLLLQHVAQHATHYSSSRPQSEESGEY